MNYRHYLLLVFLAAPAWSQICNCPLVSVDTTTAPFPCPTNDILTLTTTSTVGACRNPRTTTTTTTYTAGVCNCPSPSTVTETATPDCYGVTSTSTAVERTIDCPYANTRTRTITQYGTGNSTVYPTSGMSGCAASTGFLPTSTSSPSATSTACPVKELPEIFYIRISPDNDYLFYDPVSHLAGSCPHKRDATAFHLNETDVFDIDGVPQLSLFSTSTPVTKDNVEYGAYVQYSGGPVRFFTPEEVPEGSREDGEDDWFIVTAGWSEYLCELSLITWNLHDLARAQSCRGVLAMGYGLGGDGEECPEVTLTIEPARGWRVEGS